MKWLWLVEIADTCVRIHRSTGFGRICFNDVEILDTEDLLIGADEGLPSVLSGRISVSSLPIWVSAHQGTLWNEKIITRGTHVGIVCGHRLLTNTVILDKQS